MAMRLRPQTNQTPAGETAGAWQTTQESHRTDTIILPEIATADNLHLFWDAHCAGQIAWSRVQAAQDQVLRRIATCRCGNAAAALVEGRAVCPLCLDLRV